MFNINAFKNFCNENNIKRIMIRNKINSFECILDYSKTRFGSLFLGVSLCELLLGDDYYNKDYDFHDIYPSDGIMHFTLSL